MAALVVLGLVMVVMGACIGAFLRLSFAIRREGRQRDSLRFDAPTRSTQVARTFVGYGSLRD